MRSGFCWFAMGVMVCRIAAAQVGPSQPYPILGAASKPPVMTLSQRDRTTVVDVTVGANGRTLTTKLVTRSGSGVFDERVRGFWKNQPFVPALDTSGRPQVAT